MNVKLIDYTGCGSSDPTWHAAEKLIFTKSTRLKMGDDLMRKIRAMSETEKLNELFYMSNTIPSSWEFVDVTFLIEGVTRATAQQITRTRNASYAMQTQRVSDIRDVPVTNPFEHGSEAEALFDGAAHGVKAVYAELIDRGAEPQDARAILPMNTQCNLVVKYNLRTLTELHKSRLQSRRAQGEYSDVVRKMTEALQDVWSPWIGYFFESNDAKAKAILNDVIDEVGLEVGKGTGWQIAKAIDLLNKG